MIGWAYIVAAPDHVSEAPIDAALAAADAGAGAGAGADGFVWIHLDGRDAEALAWLREQPHLPEAAQAALLAHETRPRGDRLGEGAIVNLRGLGATPDDDPDALVSIRLWADAGRVISVSMRTMADIDLLRRAVAAGEVLDPGDLIVTLAGIITGRLDPEVARLGDLVDDYETMLETRPIAGARRRIAQARSTAIDYRRFMAPQRLALDRLAQTQCDWLTDEDRLHLREAADRAARMAEELEAVRERSALLHEQLTDMRTEQIDQRSLTVAMIALIFLPLTFVTGLFGMNVPVPQWPHAFWWITAGSIAFGLTLWAVVRRRR